MRLANWQHSVIIVATVLAIMISPIILMNMDKGHEPISGLMVNVESVGFVDSAVWDAAKSANRYGMMSVSADSSPSQPMCTKTERKCSYKKTGHYYDAATNSHYTSYKKICFNVAKRAPCG